MFMCSCVRACACVCVSVCVWFWTTHACARTRAAWWRQRRPALWAGAAAGRGQRERVGRALRELRRRTGAREEGDTRISDVPRTPEAIVHEDHEAVRDVTRRCAGTSASDCDTTVEVGRFQGTVRHGGLDVGGELIVLGGAAPRTVMVILFLQAKTRELCRAGGEGGSRSVQRSTRD